MAKKKISEALRKRLLGHKSSGRGILIDNKSMTKITFRSLPRPQVMRGEDPCVPYVSIYSKALNKGVTSPRSFGMKCPVLDALDELRISGSKDEKEAGYTAAKGQREFWLPVVLKGALGTAESPNVRVLRMKVEPHDQLLDHITAEDDVVDDITDPEDGSYVIYEKTVEEGNTKYHIVKVLEPSPMTDDAALQAKLVEMAASFDVSGFFYSLDWEKLNEIYNALMGEDIPAAYREQDGGPDSEKPAPGAGIEADGADGADGGDAGGEPAESAGTDTLSVLIDGEEQPVELGVTVVEGILTAAEDVVLQGVIMKIGEPDDDGDVPVDIRYDDEQGGEQWTTVFPKYTALTLVTPEPEEVPPTKAPKKPAPRKPKTPVKTPARRSAGKPAAKKTGKPAAKKTGMASARLRGRLGNKKKK